MFASAVSGVGTSYPTLQDGPSLGLDGPWPKTSAAAAAPRRPSLRPVPAGLLDPPGRLEGWARRGPLSSAPPSPPTVWLPDCLRRFARRSAPDPRVAASRRPPALRALSARLEGRVSDGSPYKRKIIKKILAKRRGAGIMCKGWEESTDSTLRPPPLTPPLSVGSPHRGYLGGRASRNVPRLTSSERFTPSPGQ